MKARHVCPNVSLNIKGVVFSANLVVLKSKGIDVILGMDWLTKYGEVIHCASRTVKLTHTNGTKIEFSSTKASSEKVTSTK